MTKAIFSFLIAIFAVTNTVQAASIHIASCTRVAGGAEYLIEIYRTSDWEPVSTNPGNNNALTHVSVTRHKNGSKNVRNYNESTMHQRLGSRNDVSISLSRRGGRIYYGVIKFDILRRHGQVQKIKNAVIDLGTAEEEKELKLECEPTVNFDTL